MATGEEFDERVRARLRQARFERGLSLSALARAAGLTTSTLSRLETGSRRLTVAHVAQLAQALGISTDRLLAPGAAAAAPADSRDGKTWTAIGPERVNGARVFRVGIPATLREPVLHGHEGHQWLYVLDGPVRLVVERHDIVLAGGEAAEFHTWRPHWLGAVDGAAEVLIVFAPHGRPFHTATLDP